MHEQQESNMLQDYQDYTGFVDDCLTSNHYDVVYRDWDGSQDFARFVADDPVHAQEQFELYYPLVEITEIIDRGPAF